MTLRNILAAGFTACLLPIAAIAATVPSPYNGTNVFNDNVAGYAPQGPASTTNYYLRGDGAWDTNLSPTSFTAQYFQLTGTNFGVCTAGFNGLFLEAANEPALCFNGTVGLNVSSGGTIMVSPGIVGTSTLVNQVVSTATATGGTPSIGCAGGGSDNPCNFNVKGKGTGIALLGQAICVQSGATPVTCNGQRGIATTTSLSTAGLAATTYTITNSSVSSSSLVMCEIEAYSGTFVTNGVPEIIACVPGSTTITVTIYNAHATNTLGGTVGIGFVVLN